MIVPIIFIALGVLVLLAAAAYVHFGSEQSKPKSTGRSTAMAHVLHHHPADSPGYTRLILRDPVGHKQASATVKAKTGTKHPDGTEVVHEIHLHGQREFDVPDGSVVTFPDGTDLHL